MTLMRWLIIALLLVVGSTFAQDAAQPLIILKAGDLWEWTGGRTLRQKTDWGFNQDIQISPIGDEVAYSSVPLIVVEFLQQNPEAYRGMPLPNNLWVLSTQASDESTRIADQPADASFNVPDVPDNVITRSGPIWSPDGQEIAWTEPVVGSSLMYQVMIYNKATQTTRILPTQVGTEGKSLPGIWTVSGLLMMGESFNVSTLVFEPTYVVLNTETGDLETPINPMRVVFAPGGNLQRVKTVPVLHDEGEWLAILYMGEQADSRWLLYNLETGKQREAPNAPRAVPWLGVEKSLTMVSHVIDGEALSYNLYGVDGRPIPLTNNPQKYVSEFSFSPDGQAVAYQLGTLGSNEPDNTIYVWRNGIIGVVPQTEGTSGAQGFAWTRATWIVDE